jgi:hypothetical protein
VRKAPPVFVHQEFNNRHAILSLACFYDVNRAPIAGGILFPNLSLRVFTRFPIPPRS